MDGGVGDSGGYTRRVRARPFGPFEITAGGVTAWFHGPFAVLTFTGSGGGDESVTVRAAADDSPAGAELAALLAAACTGRTADLPCPGLLVAEARLTQSVVLVRRVSARPGPGGVLFTVETSAQSVEVVLTLADAEELAERARGWVEQTAHP